MNSHISRTYPKPKQEPGIKRPLLAIGAVLAASIVVGVLIAGHDEPKATKRTQVSQRSQAAQTAPAVARRPVLTTPAPAAPPTDAFGETSSEKLLAQTAGSEGASGTGAAIPAEPVAYQEAEAAFLAGDYALAADLFGRYTADKPNNPWGHYLHGLALRRTGDFAASESAFLACLAIDPDHVKSLVNLGRVRLDDGRAVEAGEVAGRAVAIDPENVDAQRTLARALHTQGRRDEALAVYDTALSIDADDAWSLNNRGLILIEEERFAEAAETLTAACAADDTKAVVRNNLGVALERTGRFADAEQAYAAALAIDAGYGKAAVSLARVEGKENEVDQAAAAPVLADGNKEESGVALVERDDMMTDAKPVIAIAAPSALEDDNSAPQGDRIVPAGSTVEERR